MGRRALAPGSRASCGGSRSSIFFGTLAQAPLGAITVHSHLNPWLVLSHFLLSIVVLTLGVALAVEVAAAPLGARAARASRSGARRRRRRLLLIVSGTLATAAGPHPGSTVVRRLWSFEPAVYWHVRATAVFGALVRGRCSSGSRVRRSRHLRGALAVLGLLAVQMTIGEVQYRTHLPWWLVLVARHRRRHRLGRDVARSSSALWRPGQRRRMPR